MAEFDPTDYDAGGGAAGSNFGSAGDPLLDGEEEDPDAKEELQLRDAVLFVIDCASPEALSPLRPNGRSVVAEALVAAVSVLKTKVLTAPDDKVGVALYGVREKHNPNSFEGIRVLQELDRPSAPRIKQLELEAARTKEQFAERYGFNQRVPLSDVFWTCTTIFNLSVNPKQFQPRVFLFTCNDAPCDGQEADAAETRARDLMDLGAIVEFFPLAMAGRAFSIERFWSRVLPVDEADYVESTAARIEELERRVRMRVHRKRIHQRLLFELCPGVEIGVSIYVTMLPATIAAPVYLLNESNKPLKSETRYICERTGSILHPKDDLETFVELCGRHVPMSREELQEVKRFFEPGLHLLGFKPAAMLKPHHRIFHSYFVYPNERGSSNAVTGSTALVSALIDQLSQRKLMAIARYIPRRNSEPVLVALLPQTESADASGTEQLQPPGFHMIRLPWREEIRDLELPMPDGVVLPTALADVAREVVRAMRIDGFRPGCVENPVLQRHFAALQALALGEDAPENTVDMLRPDVAALQEKEPMLGAWKEAIEVASAAMATTPAFSQKRPQATFASEDGSLRAVRPRRETVGATETPTTLDAMRDVVQSGEVDRLTVGQLKDWLKAQGICASGKKADLLERVKACA